MDIGYATEKFEVPAWIFEVAADCSAHGSHVLNSEGLGMVRQVPRVLPWVQGQVFLRDFLGRSSRSWMPSLPVRGGLEALTRRGQDQLQYYQFDGGGKLRASKE